MYYWLSIPEGQEEGENYQSQITIAAVKSGTSPASSGGGEKPATSSTPIPSSTEQETSEKEEGKGASVNVIKLN